MAVNSVSSTTNPYTTALQASETQRNQQAQRVEQQEPKVQEQAEKKAAKPVVNLQGQVTGTLVNETA